MQFINDFFETKPSTNTGTLSPAVKSVTNLSRIAPNSMQTTLVAKQGKAAFMTKIRSNAQSVDNIDTKSMMITELS